MLNKVHKGDKLPLGKSAAVLTIAKAGEMTPEGRGYIAAWLRRHADLIETEGENYASRFCGRYLVAD